MTRLSAAYFPHAKSPEYKSEAYIFLQQMSIAVLPFRTGSSYPFTVTLSENDENLENDLIGFLRSLGTYGNANSLTDAFYDAIDSIARYLVANGEAYLEIAGNSTQTGIHDKHLELVPPGTIIRAFDKYFQIVPKPDWEYAHRKYFVIPASRILHIKLPRSLGSPRTHRRMLKKLGAVPSSIPNFVLESGDFGNSLQFEPRVDQHIRTVAVERTTRRWGSILNQNLNEDITGFHDIVEELKIAYTKALIREHITEKLQTVLTGLGITTRLEISGLKSTREIRRTIQRLEKGEIDLAQARKDGLDRE